jgi:hypothetical protein
MRRHRFFLPWIAMGVVLALAPHASAQVPTQDSVTAGGLILGTGFSVNAQSGPSGENPTGTARLSSPSVVGSRVEGPVTCLSVTGNRAVIGFANTLGNPFLGVGGFIEVTDGTPDTFTATLIASGEPPTVCPPTLGMGGTALLVGGIVVVDAPALPTSKDQCNNGGWQGYGIFKNQGDCVSFVATGGKNPPGK